ncbi:MAG: hypothetical protein RQ741_09260 [Wenzhouxiangellaceae bacterium]|nr:hypothetical protein [Wenzhouxiangellaceae bacterium]
MRSIVETSGAPGIRAIRLAIAVCALLLLAACAPGPDQAEVALAPGDREAAQKWLYPAFEQSHGALIELDGTIEAGLLRVLDRLALTGDDAEAAPPAHDYQLVWTANADADAGCLADGRIFISRGLLAWLESTDELAGVVAVAMQQCPAASQAWRKRDEARPAPLDLDDPLMLRYRDFRLPANAALYNQLVLNCRSPGCIEAATGRVRQAGFDAAHLARLAARLRQHRPASAWLARIGERQQGTAGSVDGPIVDHLIDEIADAAADATVDPIGNLPGDADADEFARLVEGFRSQREGLVELAAARQLLLDGDLLEAYRANIRARRVLGATPAVLMMQAELDLANYHPDYAQRILQGLEGDGVEILGEHYWWGWTHSQLKRQHQAIEALRQSIRSCPRVSAHYMLAELLVRAGEADEAVEHFRLVAEAGALHPFSASAASRLAQLEAR